MREITVADVPERTHRHEANHQRRERIAGEQDELLNDVGPEQQQRGELSDEPQNSRDQHLDGEAVEVAEDVPPRAVRTGVAFDHEERVVLIMHVHRINAQAAQDRILQQRLHPVSPLRQHHEQGREDHQAHQVEHQPFSREAANDEQNRSDRKQHERHQPQQFVQLGAFLDERRKETLEGGHNSGASPHHGSHDVMSGRAKGQVRERRCRRSLP